MNNGQRQRLKLQQKLSPQQLQLMELIQLPITALELRIKEEVEKNPLLEIPSAETKNIEALPEQSIADAGADEGVDTEDDDYSYRERQERDRNQDPRQPNFISESSFGDQLLDQLTLRNLSARQMLIAQELVGSLNDAGYIERSVELIANDLAFTQGLEVSPIEVIDVLKEIHQLDPPGIGARNLQECLSIQLHRMPQSPAVADAITIIDNCFDYYSKHNYNRIQERFSFSDQQLSDADAIIHSLDPKPGMGESESSHAHYIIPDFIVTRHDGQLDLVITDSHLPQLQFSDYYQQMLSDISAKAKLSPSESDTLEFLRANNDSANLLVSSLKQRHATMLQVMKVVLRVQRKFFLSGDTADIVPLLQKDVAETTGLDISTISRVVNSKYVQTDFGTFLLKECFSNSITNKQGEEVSTEAIRQALQDAVESEDKTAPLSDDALAQVLAEKGFPVARRTVAKYRAMLGIPIGSQRRKLKTIVILLLMVLSGAVYAQQPQKESYFDSLLNARIREGQATARATNPANDKPAKGKGKSAKSTSDNTRALEIHEPEPEPTAIDTALATGDELINVLYDASLPAPSALWYGRNLSGAHVRMANLSMDSLPDEISIQLLKNQEKFCFPVKNVKTSPYGWRWERPHRGVDIRLKTGDPVHAAFNGVVRIARPMGGYGNLVVIRHYNGLETVYGHLSQIKVKPLQVVAAGQVIGLGGSTGHSTGPHLHFEVRFQYEAFDPEWILDFSNYSLRTRRLYLDKTYFGIRKPRAGENLNYKADKSIVPEEQAKPKQPAKPVYAAIKKGESLESFAKRNYTTVDKLNTLNPDLDKPKPGTRIRVR